MQHCQLGSPNPVVGSIGPAGSHWNIPTRSVPPRGRGDGGGVGFGFPPPVHAAAKRAMAMIGAMTREDPLTRPFPQTTAERVSAIQARFGSRHPPFSRSIAPTAAMRNAATIVAAYFRG